MWVPSVNGCVCLTWFTRQTPLPNFLPPLQPPLTHPPPLSLSLFHIHSIKHIAYWNQKSSYFCKCRCFFLHRHSEYQKVTVYYNKVNGAIVLKMSVFFNSQILIYNWHVCMCIYICMYMCVCIHIYIYIQFLQKEHFTLGFCISVVNGSTQCLWPSPILHFSHAPIHTFFLHNMTFFLFMRNLIWM